MICFLNFHETLSLASATSGNICLYGEHEVSELIGRLRRGERVCAVIFETGLKLDAWHLARSCGIPVLLPSSLEEMYRMMITVPVPAAIYVCRELARRREAFEISGYVSDKEPRQIPEDINAAVSSCDIDYALSLYQDIEEAAERAGTSGREGMSGSGRSRNAAHGRLRLMRMRQTGHTQVCVFVTGYLRPMVRYLLEGSRSIDVGYISGFNNRIHYELQKLAAGYKRIIWISAADTACADMLPDRDTRRITVRGMHELYESLLRELPREQRRELSYPGRPVEWPARHLPAVPETEQRMCPGCIHRKSDTDEAYCMKLGIDVFRQPAQGRGGEMSFNYAANQDRDRRVIIGRSDEERVQRHGHRYAIRTFACSQCGICAADFGCPAICRDGLHYHIDSYLCSGCGDCVGICPEQAIYSFISESGLS